MALIIFAGGAMIYELATRAFLEISVLHERTPLFTFCAMARSATPISWRISNKRPEGRLVQSLLRAGKSVARNFRPDPRHRLAPHG